MREKLKKNQTIVFGSRADKLAVNIDSFLDSGGSCLVYNVTYTMSDGVIHHGILKEYYPSFLESVVECQRNQDGSIIIPSDCAEVFNIGFECFKNTYININDYLYNNLSASNYHTVQLGLYEGNNTAYTLVSCDFGKSYDKITDNSLYELLRITLSVTKAVDLYHNAGFLHLDIKPKNVFILDGVTDLVKLFDFDSLTSIDGLKNGSVTKVPIPEDYYVPELSKCDIHSISIKTDMFEIGAMLFERLFNRAPESEDTAYDAKYNFDSVSLLNGISPQAKYELEQIFKHTLQTSPRQRYNNTTELKDSLIKLINLVGNDKTYLINLPKWQPSKYCVGRKDEIKEIKARLDNDGYVFIKAMGGTGKSELAKLYADKFSSEYHTVQFCKYTGSLKSVVASLDVNGIKDRDYTNIEELAKEKNKVLHSSDNHTLLIIDNFNVTHDEYLREFLPTNSNGFKVIFTTRCMPAAEYYCDKVMELESLPKDVAIYLFYSISKIENNQDNDKTINSIIETIQCNALVLVLVAQTIKNKNCTLSDIEEKLVNSRLENINGKVFHEYDFSSIDGENYNLVFAHLNTIFNISNLNNIQKEILKNLTLIANIGIDTDSFIRNCENDLINKNEINQLIDMGWINTENEYIVLHPIVSDLIFLNDNIEKSKSFNTFANNIVGECYSFDNVHIDAVNVKFAYLYHLDKRFIDEISFISIDIKLSLARQYKNLFDAKNAKKKYIEASELIKHSFRYKPRNCFVYLGLAEIEEDFGSLDGAIELYKKAENCCKKLPNMFYGIHLDSIRGIGSCYQEKHNYEKSYEYYTKAYRYTQGFDSGDLLKKLLFPSQIKDLTDSIPELCDRIIEVCRELEKYDEIEKFKRIKSETLDCIRKSSDEDLSNFEKFNDATKYVDRARACFHRGNLKEGMKEFNEYMKYLKEMFGENSPQYKDIECLTIPGMVAVSNGTVSYQALDDCVEFIKEIYGENSKRFADYLVYISEYISDTADYKVTEMYTKKAKEIYKGLGLNNSYNYQEANIIMISSLILQGKIGKLNSLVEEIDFSMFKSKQDFEKLVKYSGSALVELKQYNKAIEICSELVKKENITPFIKLMAYDDIVLAFLEQEKSNEAFSYLKKEKAVFDELDDSPQKDVYMSNYICNLSQAYSQIGDFEKSSKIIEEFLKNKLKQNSFLDNMSLSKLYIFRTESYRYQRDFEGALHSIKDAIPLLKQDLIYKFKIKILYLLSISFAATGEIKTGIDYFSEFENAFNTESEYTQLDMLEYLVYFIDSLIVGRSYRCYEYIEKAQKIVDKNNFHNIELNAQLENYLGVYLSDYEEEHGWARNHFEKSKEILEELGDTTSDLYKQVVANIDYVSDLIMKSLIKDMAQSMIEENKPYSEEDEDE